VSKYEEIFPGHTKYVPVARKHQSFKEADPHSMTSIKRMKRLMKQNKTMVMRTKCLEKLAELKKLKKEVPEAIRNQLKLSVNLSINPNKMSHKELTGVHGWLLEEIRTLTPIIKEIKDER
jgi:anion-transporting  ArsA/GET3 family ATPase